MGTQATSVNVKNPQTSNHSKSTLIPLFQKLVVMLIVALPVTFGPGLPALIGRATWRYGFCRLITSDTRVLSKQGDVIDFANSDKIVLHTNYFRCHILHTNYFRCQSGIYYYLDR